MTRLLSLAACVLLAAGCACCSPTGSAQHDVDALKAQYSAAIAVEGVYRALPWCLPQAVANCQTHAEREKIKTLEYDASADLMVAESSLEQGAIEQARKSVKAFKDETDTLGLQP